ncbi:DNA invertase [Candidatus Thiomargarita nelsonii]|uniref:DNA invertase n=1 Tax=Candidatus Thiomargarita nelsonii TaxID=1003181 RepID=A0A0A6P4N3_9GAMM|nr:DNA invertase [Candidatus Thiomargarita nelsonii]
MIDVTSKEASKLLGLHPNTLRHYADNGSIETYRTKSGQRRDNVEAYLGLQKQSVTICYCRVSSPKQREDLKRQVQYMREQYPKAEIIKDIVRSLNYKRKGLKAILGRAMRGEQLEIVVAHKDRLARFGFELIEWIIQQSSGRIMVLKQTNLSPEQELTNDLLSILHVFSCRMHGLRNYKSQVRQALSEPETKAHIQKME